MYWDKPSAKVSAIGQKVTNLKVSDRVAVEPTINCLKCDFCRRGRYNLCPISNTFSWITANGWLFAPILYSSIRILLQVIVLKCFEIMTKNDYSLIFWKWEEFQIRWVGMRGQWLSWWRAANSWSQCARLWRRSCRYNELIMC